MKAGSAEIGAKGGEGSTVTNLRGPTSTSNFPSKSSPSAKRSKRGGSWGLALSKRGHQGSVQMEVPSSDMSLGGTPKIEEAVECGLDLLKGCSNPCGLQAAKCNDVD